MSRTFVSHRYQKPQKSSFSAITQQATQYDDLINFGVGDPDLNTDARIIDAAFQDAKNGYTHYGNPRGDIQLRQAIQSMYQEDYGVSVHMEEIFVTASANVAMHLTLESILNDGEEVVVIAPYFFMYKSMISMSRGICVECPTYFEDGFQIRKEVLESCINKNTKAIIINTPTNPTGNCLTLECLQMIVDLAIEHDLVIIADDIYTIYSYREPFHPLIQFSQLRDRLITINSFSKDFIMTGWRLGYIVAPSSLINTIAEVNDAVVYTAPIISQRAGLYAMQHRHEIQPAISKEYQVRLQYACDRIKKYNKLDVLTPAGGTFYLFVDIRKTNMTSLDFCKWLLENAHILTLPGDLFGACGEGFVRLAVTMNIDKLKEAFDRMDELIDLR